MLSLYTELIFRSIYVPDKGLSLFNEHSISVLHGPVYCENFSCEVILKIVLFYA